MTQKEATVCFTEVEVGGDLTYNQVHIAQKLMLAIGHPFQTLKPGLQILHNIILG